jgi:hypothetical protein
METFLLKCSRCSSMFPAYGATIYVESKTDDSCNLGYLVIKCPICFKKEEIKP